MNECQSDYWELLGALKSSTTTETAASFITKYLKTTAKCGEHDVRSLVTYSISSAGHYAREYDINYAVCPENMQSIALSVLQGKKWMIEQSMLEQMPIKYRILHRLPTVTYGKTDSVLWVNVELNNNGKKLIDNTYSSLKL